MVAQSALRMDNGLTWQHQLREAITTPEELVAEGLITPAQAEANPALYANYRLRIPRAYAALIDRSNTAQCPIYRQAIPQPSEHDVALPPWAQAMSQRLYGRDAPWHADAIGDVAHLAAPRLTHRYAHRALLHVTSACALYCRFCFRKAHLAQSEESLYSGSLAPALAYLIAHPEIQELILTGGDPLSMGDLWLSRLMEQLARLPHLRVIRLHSRMATTLPARLTAELWAVLQKAAPHQQVVLVSHFNHVKELTAAAQDALRAGRRAGITLLNQSALLAGVNDDVHALHDLCAGLWQLGVVPYYLHHPDWTPGTFGFRLTIGAGRALMGQLAGLLSGPALPNYVLDVPFGRGKVRLMETSVTPLTGDADRHDDGVLTGGVWQIKLPHTRSGQGNVAYYLDLAATRVVASHSNL